MLKSVHHADGSVHQRHMGGWKKQTTDARDDVYRLKFHPLFSAAPTSFDNRRICSPIVDQGDLGSCTSQAFAALIESNEIKRIGPKADAPVGSAVISNFATDPKTGHITFLTTVTPPTPAPPAPTPPTPPTPPAPPKPAVLERVSRLFEYYGTRTIEGTVSEDSGASIRDAIKSGVQYGVADEAQWPYDVSQFATKPPIAVWTAAAAHKVVSYHAINDGDLPTMKVALAAGSLIEFGFTVYDSFMSAQMAQTGIMPMPGPGEQVQGGHAVAIVGFADDYAAAQTMGYTGSKTDFGAGAFLVRNSWGPNWGIAGYFWAPYAFVANTNQCSDFWVVTSTPI